jgi:hypothetical protein
MIKERLIGYIEQSIRKNWDMEALSNYKETGYTKQLRRKFLSFIFCLKKQGLKREIKLLL